MRISNARAPTIGRSPIALTPGMAHDAPMSADTSPVEIAPPPFGRRFAAANPAELGFDADALADAVRFASGLRSSSVRVYRHGCLADRKSVV